jgi:hypothetical protein
MKLSKDSDVNPGDPTEYQSLRYLLHTRPELTFSVSYLSRFMENPRQDHMGAIKHLLRYIAGTVDYGLFYPRGRGEGFGILGYSDSDMTGDVDDSKSTSGMIYFLGENPATWNSQKQRVVALSSCEATDNFLEVLSVGGGIWSRGLATQRQQQSPHPELAPRRRGIPELGADGRAASVGRVHVHPPPQACAHGPPRRPPSCRGTAAPGHARHRGPR